MRFIVLGLCGAYIIDAEDWDSALWTAQNYSGDNLMSITVIPREDET